MRAPSWRLACVPRLRVLTSLAQLADEGDTLSGRIAITASERGGQLIIERAFGSFRQKHPGVQLEICTDLALEDLLASAVAMLAFG